MSYSVMGSKNNSCWPVPMGTIRGPTGPIVTVGGRQVGVVRPVIRPGPGARRHSMGALMQSTAGTGLFRNAPWRRAMGDLMPGGIGGIGNFAIDSSGDAVALDPPTKGVFIDLQNQANRLCAYYGFGSLMLGVDGIIGPNTQAAIAAILGMLGQAGDISSLEYLETADISTVASKADTLASYFEQQATALGAPAVAGPPVGRAGGGSGAAPAPATAVAKNNTVRTPMLLFGAIDLTDPLTWAMIAAAGGVAYMVGRKNKRGGGRRRAPRKRARARRRPARRRPARRRKGRR